MLRGVLFDEVGQFMAVCSKEVFRISGDPDRALLSLILSHCSGFQGILQDEFKSRTLSETFCKVLLRLCRVLGQVLQSALVRRSLLPPS